MFRITESTSISSTSISVGIGNINALGMIFLVGMRRTDSSNGKTDIRLFLYLGILVTVDPELRGAISAWNQVKCDETTNKIGG